MAKAYPSQKAPVKNATVKAPKDRDLCKILCECDEKARKMGFGGLNDLRTRLSAGTDADARKNLDVLAGEMAKKHPEQFGKNKGVAATKLLDSVSTLNWSWWKNRTATSLKKAAAKAVATYNANKESSR